MDFSDVLLGWPADRQLSAGLVSQIQQVDLDKLRRLASGEQKAVDWSDLAARAQPPRAFRGDSSSESISALDARAAGEKLLRQNRVAMILVAGGQGTRLGFDQPKGLYRIGPVSERTLFEFQIDQLQAIRSRYQAEIPLLVMTSPATHEDTVAYFEEQNQFGMDDSQLTIFCQGTMPALDAGTGKLLLAAPDRLFQSPNGHGGLVDALVDHGLLERMRERGVEHFFYAQIDNPLVQVCDRLLMGYHALSESEMTTQVVQKADPLEKVGNVVDIDGKVQIIEYSDLPEEYALKQTEDESMYLWAGNIAVHVFKLDFLIRVSNSTDSLPFHLARKKVPYVDESGQLIEPEQPNAIKFEKFIFDLLPQAENAIAVEVEKSQGFAPVKNADGAPSDTPRLAREAISNLHRGWLREMGVEVADGVRIEIHPGFALGPDELRERELVKRIEEDTYLA